MKNALCHMLGVEHPIIAAPREPDLSGPELVAAGEQCRRPWHPASTVSTRAPRFREEIRRVPGADRQAVSA